MTLSELANLINQHDLTFAYSDDGSVWSRGQAELHRIREAAKDFPVEEVERIWNAKVDRTLIESARKQFYWRNENA